MLVSRGCSTMTNSFGRVTAQNEILKGLGIPSENIHNVTANSRLNFKEDPNDSFQKNVSLALEKLKSVDRPELVLMVHSHGEMDMSVIRIRESILTNVGPELSIRRS